MQVHTRGISARGNRMTSGITDDTDAPAAALAPDTTTSTTGTTDDAANDAGALVGSSPTSMKRGKRWWLGFAAGFLVIVLGAEIGMRLGADRISQPRNYFSGNADTVVHDMKVLQAAGIKSDITFVGTSQVRRSVEDDQVERELGVKYAHNVALPGAQTPVVKRWMLEEVVPRIHPKRVVWGTQSIDFNANRSRKSIVFYNRARATKQGFYGAADRLLEKSAISEHRVELRDPVALSQDLTGTPARFDKKRPIGDLASWATGYGNVSAADLRRIRANHRKEVRDQQLLNFEIGAEEMRAYEDTLAGLRDQGIEVAVVIMPVPSHYFELHPNGKADWDRWRVAVTEAAERARVPIFDMSQSIPDDGFRDSEHMFTKAARDFTNQIDTKLRDELGW